MRNKIVHCLICSSKFKLADALLVPAGTAASPDAKIPTRPTVVRLRELPLDHNRVCPTCKWPLTYAQATGQLSLYPIAIAGGPGVSKSHLFPILIDQAKTRLRSTIEDFDITAQDTRAPGDAFSFCSVQYLATHYAPVFSDDVRRTVIAKTPRSGSDSASRTPLIYRFSFPANGWFPTRSRKCVEFAFRDCAGEEFVEPGPIREFHRYITSSAGILLLVDPLSIRGLRELIPQADSQYQDRAIRRFEFDQIIASLIGLFERIENIRVGRRIRTPLAIIITKADMLRQIEGAAGAIFREPDLLHSGGFNFHGVKRQNQQLRRLLVDCGRHDIMRTVDVNFKTVSLFASSALGHAPALVKNNENDEMEQRIGHIQPWRVLDPLVWLLHHYRYIKACKEAPACSS